MPVKEIDRALIKAVAPMFFVTNQKDFEKALKQVIKRPEKTEMLIEGADAVTHVYDNGATIVVVPLMKRKKTAEAHAIIVHEAMHVWRVIRESIRELEPSEEFEAYAMGSICQRFFDLYEKDLRKAEKKAARKAKVKDSK